MTLEKLRTLCLSFPGATEQIQWGADLVFKVGGKMFCVACTEPVSPPKVAMSFKCDDEAFAELIEVEGAMPAPTGQAKWVALEAFDTRCPIAADAAGEACDELCGTNCRRRQFLP